MADLRSLFENSLQNTHDLEALRERIAQIVSDSLARGEDPGANQLTPEQIRNLISGLPRLTEEQIRDFGDHDALCPICYTPFAAILAEEETALAMDSPAYPADQLGVTKLGENWQCGHLFCRREFATSTLKPTMFILLTIFLQHLQMDPRGARIVPDVPPLACRVYYHCG
ncbi:hypothetical protein B0H16DRAFT_1497751 [Mycena metata]|uniref:RING-type domain-containing protein n=1 Tax=Mycena metata TaxID=1033252 RepID=A0AAD7K9Z1_9AGAR|nr:hypothetical protein B0H16DRAFT_1497751 [Mycena metata]